MRWNAQDCDRLSRTAEARAVVDHGHEARFIKR